MGESRSWLRRRGDGSSSERRVVGLLAPASFFEGYDDLILGLALPLIRADFGLSLAAAGLAASVIRWGALGVLILLPLADRYGRRPILTITIAGYTLATFATAFSIGVFDFVALQFVARIFLGTEYALATIVLVELLGTERRGRALALVSSMSAFGNAGAGVGFLMVDAVGASWRSLYLAGILPLILVFLARRALPETASWHWKEVSRRPSLAGVRRGWLAGAASLAFLFAIFPVALTTFASTLVRDEWKWDLASINPGYVAVWVLAVGGFFVGGRLVDGWGRRPTAIAFMGGAAAAGLVAFRMPGTLGRVLGLALVIFFLTGSTPCVAAYTTEPFPTASRGRLGAWLRVAGIAGGALAPAITGVLADAFGLSAALSVVGLSYAVAAAVVFGLLPETRGLEVDRAVDVLGSP
jgi:MFS family permease